MARSTGFSAKVRDLIIARAGGYCERCGQRAVDPQVHHRRPRGMGGTRRADTNEPPAGLFLCAACHIYVESHRRESLEKGWLVRQAKSPADTPVLYHMTYWARLTPDGAVARIAPEEVRS